VRPSEPPFALCGPRGALVADGMQARFCDVPAAEAALRSGRCQYCWARYPFDVNAPAALMVAGHGTAHRCAASLADRLPGRVQARGDFVVAQSLGGIQHDLGSHDF